MNLIIHRNFFLLTLLVSLAISKKLYCDNFTSGAWWHASVYECRDATTQITSKNDTVVTGRAGMRHFYGKDDASVGSLWMTETKVFYFPTKIESVFPNLIAISITNCQLKEIHQSDLKPFSKLEKIFVQSNNLAVLEQELFKYNPKIMRMNFADNNIVHVESSVFINLQNLQFLNFNNNPCYSDYINDNHLSVLNLVLSIQLECFDKEIYKELRKLNF